ncbi:MAG TPA: penicillin acylase family protein [Burkholderiales bacterium]|nr:penicillin acylase family protein [Burkholderiales bacterium]
MPHRAVQTIIKAGLTVLLLAGAGAMGAYSYLRLSLPRVAGEMQISGVAAPIEVLRDPHGIPHIFAQSERDAHFALGFVHAQDRLWQMEMNRRIASGRLAEALGPNALETDRFLRTVGIRRAAEANVARLDAETRGLLDAYASGVNAFLNTHPVLPIEFWIFGVKPQAWSAVDSAAWAKMVAWDLGGNWRRELLRLQLARRLPTAAIQEFLPPYPGDAPVALPELRDFYGALEREPPQLSASERFVGASNSWAVSGARSTSGKPLLANDPHLGLTAPGIWYFAHLHAPGLDAIGATLPGVPGVVLGRNERIAWAATNTGPDVQDLYLEKIDAAGRYLTPQGPVAFVTLRETIKVKGAADEVLTVRVSRHGPVISDVVQNALDAIPRGHALAFAWTALAEDDASLAAVFKIPRSRNWGEFTASLREFHAPQQNLSYADVEGNIGFIAPGRIPIRKAANLLKGLAPAPGWDEGYDWTGYIPFEDLPRAFNPASAKLVTANQKIVPPGYRYHISAEWAAPYRAQRIDALLDTQVKHDRSSFARMQMDVVSLPVRELLPRMTGIQGGSPEAREALKWVAAWDGTMSPERAEPLIFAAWWREFSRAVYADELGGAFRGAWSEQAAFLSNVLADKDGQARWCDDVRTRRVESCDDVLSSALEKALADLRGRYGNDAAGWRWGAAHEARLRHRPLSRSAWLRPYFDIAVPTGGDSYTVNVGRMDFADDAEPFANRHAASLRAVYDLADPEASVFIHPGGQSGNPLSPHYRDFALLWARGDYVPMITQRSRLEAGATTRLVLKGPR